MSANLPIIRLEQLHHLADFCRELHAGLAAAGQAPEQIPVVFQEAITARCINCGVQVSGAELLALSQPPAPDRSTARTRRLRMGDCAVKGCDASCYRLTFLALPQLDWAGLLGKLDAQDQPTAEPPRPPRAAALAWRGLFPPERLWRIGLAFTVILVLLLARQWHQGGRIPILREPEEFRVTTQTEAETASPDPSPAP